VHPVRARRNAGIVQGAIIVIPDVAESRCTTKAGVAGQIAKGNDQGLDTFDIGITAHHNIDGLACLTNAED